MPLNSETHVIQTLGDNPQTRHLAMQGSEPALWIEVEPGADVVYFRTFTWFGTGHAIPDGFTYVGTVQKGVFVFHLYEEVG